MILYLLLLIVGFILLIKGADFFVDSASNTALNFKVSKMLIGLTIVAFGTSAPEFAVSISAIASRNADMVLGNVIGSCIMNILLILGVAAVIKPIKISDNAVKKELPLSLLISCLLVVLFIDIPLNGDAVNKITRSDAVVILLFFVVFLYYLFSLALKKKYDKDEEKPDIGLLKSLLFVGLGLVGIIVGSNLVVDNATKIAEAIGISQRIIALSIVAFGTSLPELVTTIVSSRKGEQELLLGNIIGSNIFNICVVLGIPVAIFGTLIPGTFQYLDLFMLFFSALVLFIFSYKDRVISKFEGIFMLLTFIIYYCIVFII